MDIRANEESINNKNKEIIDSIRIQVWLEIIIVRKLKNNNDITSGEKVVDKSNDKRYN